TKTKTPIQSSLSSSSPLPSFFGQSSNNNGELRPASSGQRASRSTGATLSTGENQRRGCYPLLSASLPSSPLFFSPFLPSCETPDDQQLARASSSGGEIASNNSVPSRLLLRRSHRSSEHQQLAATSELVATGEARSFLEFCTRRISTDPSRFDFV
ncbi:hypothetical protein AABB24_010501, partial [Solanum stoloniferum]